MSENNHLPPSSLSSVPESRRFSTDLASEICNMQARDNDLRKQKWLQLDTSDKYTSDALINLNQSSKARIKKFEQSMMSGKCDNRIKFKSLASTSSPCFEVVAQPSYYFAQQLALPQPWSTGYSFWIQPNQLLSNSQEHPQQIRIQLLQKAQAYEESVAYFNRGGYSSNLIRRGRWIDSDVRSCSTQTETSTSTETNEVEQKKLEQPSQVDISEMDPPQDQPQDQTPSTSDQLIMEKIDMEQPEDEKDVSPKDVAMVSSSKKNMNKLPEKPEPSEKSEVSSRRDAIPSSTQELSTITDQRRKNAREKKKALEDKSKTSNATNVLPERSKLESKIDDVAFDLMLAQFAKEDQEVVKKMIRKDRPLAQTHPTPLPTMKRGRLEKLRRDKAAAATPPNQFFDAAVAIQNWTEHREEFERKAEGQITEFSIFMDKCVSGESNYRGWPRCSIRNFKERHATTAQRDTEIRDFLRQRLEVLDGAGEDDVHGNILRFLYGLMIRHYTSNLGPLLQVLVMNPLLVSSLTGQTVRGFVLEALLGQGCYGAVYRARCDDEIIAVKVSTYFEEYANEVACLQALYCVPSVAPRIHFNEEHLSYFFFGMSLCGPDLETLRRSSPLGKFNPKVMQQVAWQAVDAMERLHLSHILHRDMKLNNIAVSQPNANAEVRLLFIDFGHSWIFEDEHGVEIEDKKNLDFSVMKHCSPNMAIGIDASTKDDLIMLIFALMHAAGFDVFTTFSQPANDLLKWKQQLLRDPTSILTNGLQWMIPFVTEISELIEGEEVDYTEIKVAIRDVVYESEPEEPLRLVQIDGLYQLQ